MDEKLKNRARLGMFVIAAIAFLVIGLYYIGSRKNFFHSKIKVSSTFNNVNGLVSGNNVRFNGINVGTVSKVYAISDTSIKVEFTINEDEREFIGKNAIASIGTDGLLGSKLLNITPGEHRGNPIEEGDAMAVTNPVQMDAAMRTLAVSNTNLKDITQNLKGVSERLNKDSPLFQLLDDSVLFGNVRTAIVKFKLTGENTATISGDLSKIVKDMKAGKGSMGALLMDTTFSHNLNQASVKIERLTDSVALISGDFKVISSRLKNGQGTLGMLLSDTAMAHNMNVSMENIKNSSAKFNENMEALKYSWPFKKYYRNKKK